MPVPVVALKSLGYEARLRFVVVKNDPADGQMTAEYGYEQLEENLKVGSERAIVFDKSEVVNRKD